ncbi:unnamed protein product [Protopolystoma xenopodis]|uniref:Steroid 5-alpha reductase C-terminal domain-containing protein n=1 Tax=Protopolystoma xenopodis TaxID=117903 RepID=A0A448XIQ2_9PLAT|nr:unnamed protein product [Protopolystoma xenopodis]
MRPIWFGLDVKLFLYRPGSLIFLVLTGCTVLQHWEKYNTVSPTLLCYFLFGYFLVFDFLFFEHNLLSTFDVQHEGVGLHFVLMKLVVIPFVYSLTLAWMADKPHLGRLPGRITGCNYVALGLGSIIFLIGYFIHRASTRQKDLIRRDPHHPSLSGMAMISTSSGKRLLAGGWWGKVRHPNYLGNLLMAYSTVIITGCCRSFVPWIYPVAQTILLIHRIWRVENSCEEKHMYAWENYCHLVPYRLIHKIF